MTAVEIEIAHQFNSKLLKPFAMRLTKDTEEANDLIQETFVKALKYKNKFREGTNVKAWLFTIMKNTFLTNYQKVVRENTFIDNTTNLHFINSTAISVSNDALAAFTMKDITDAMASLDEDNMEPFLLYFNGFKYYEIAERLNIPIGTVKNRIFLARKTLKEKLSIYSLDKAAEQ
jgi:RNA polymerase sigma factor (sigma-70 family)